MKKKALKSRNKSTEWKEKSIDSQKASFARSLATMQQPQRPSFRDSG